MALDNNYPAPSTEHVFTDHSNLRQGPFSNPAMAGGANFFTVADLQRGYRSAIPALDQVAANAVSPAIAAGARHVGLSVSCSDRVTVFTVKLLKMEAGNPVPVLVKSWANVNNGSLFADGQSGIDLEGCDLKVEVADYNGAGKVSISIVQLN